VFVVFAKVEANGGEARVWSGFTGAHLGWFVDDLAAAFGCGGSEELGSAAGEVNVDAARSWACSFTFRCSGDGGDGVGYSQT
jgi:hypothetical protein